jgi:hypothetical protein
MIDTLKLSKGLQRAGMSVAEAEAITEALNEAQTDYVTKQDLDLALEKLMGRITGRFIGVLAAQSALILGAVYFMLVHLKP